METVFEPMLGVIPTVMSVCPPVLLGKPLESALSPCKIPRLYPMKFLQIV